MLKAIGPLFIWFSFLSTGISDDRLGDLYYDSLKLGELKQRDVFPVDSQFLNFSDSDEYFFKYSLHNSISTEVDTLLDEWVNNIQKDKNCPNVKYIQHRDYFNYLFRLISINYFYESLISSKELEVNLGKSSVNCSLDWKNVFSSCRPKSADMKKYLARLNNRHLKGVNLNGFSKVRRTDLEKFIKRIKDDPSDIRNILLTGLNCKNSNCLESKHLGVKSSCKEIKTQITNFAVKVINTLE